MRRTHVAVVTLATTLAAGLVATAVPTAAQADGRRFTPGAAGIGDPYFPLDGNGGYDVRHYDLELAYDPATDRLDGVATITARATQDLSSFDLDLDGLTVRSVTVDGHRARWRRDGQELVVTPRRGLRDGDRYTTVVRYDGVPQTIEDPLLGVSGFLHTDDGAVVAGQPHVAATWFPVNDHPSDRASYALHVTAPTGLDVVSNGRLAGKRARGDRTRWTWEAADPMASYLVTLAIGDYDVTTRRDRGVRYLDAVDPDLSVPFAAPLTGSRFLYSGQADSSWKRLVRTVDVPAGGATLGFDVARDTEQDWDYFFVEARTAGGDDWTTLPDTNGHTTQDTGASCTGGWQETHPATTRYQTIASDLASCDPTGTSGAWWAASGSSGGYEHWSIDLSAYAGRQVEVSLSYASDSAFQLPGVAVDDVVVSTGAGTTSFEDDGDTLDGWTVAGPPAGSPGNDNDWESSTADAIPTVGDVVEASLAREPEIVRFLSDTFGRYPFKDAGAIVPDDFRLSFALETQTRPVYSPAFFTDTVNGNSVLVHELAHQWFGDDLTVRRWQHIWLNEGFATYAEWLWSEHEGLASAQDSFDLYASIPADATGFWDLTIGDPGADRLFDAPVYLRGAMTLHALRQRIGDRAFFRLLHRWADQRSGRTVTTDQFVALAEKVSGQDLGDFFTTWLFTADKPAGIEPAPAAAALARRAAPPAVPGAAAARHRRR